MSLCRAVALSQQKRSSDVHLPPQTLYPYTSQYADELSFQADVVIALTKQVDSEWYEGRLNGQTGLVPYNYIRIIQPPVVQDLNDTIQSSVGHMS